MSLRRIRRAAVVLLAVVPSISVGLLASEAAASPPVIIGWASNFDVKNTTDLECEGFEIEIEDINDVNVYYTYGNYHYGRARSITNTTFASGHSGVSVRYEATNTGGVWSSKTPIGMVEHFGVSLNAPAGIQRYSWLCDDPLNPGTLIEYGGSTEGNHYPMPVPAAPRAVVVPTPQGEVVRVEVENAEPPEPGQDRPDATWVQRYRASSADNVTLDDLMSGDAVVMDTIANSMLDGQFELIDGGNSLLDDDPISAADEATVVVVDTYEYTGPYDDSHTPDCDGAGGATDCTNFIGASRLARQMFSADVATATTTRSPLNVKVYTGLSASTVGGSVSSGTIPSADPEIGIDCGSSCFTVVDGGTSLTLTAMPEPGYHLDRWGGVCSGSAATCAVTVSGVTPVSATFLPDDPAVFIADPFITEGAGGTSQNMSYTFALSEPQTTATVVSYATRNGTALAGSDYVAKTGTVRFAAGQTSKTVVVRVNGDAAVEGDEAFAVDLTGVTPVSIALATPSATGTIQDDDTTAAAAASLGATTLIEGNTGTQSATVSVNLSVPLTTPTPIAYRTSNGTAEAGSDYVAKAGTVTVPAGATSAKITVKVNGDSLAEGDESFRVTIEGTGASGVATDHDKVLVSILDDDGVALSGVGIGDGETVEGQTGKSIVTLVVTLSAPRGTNTVVRYRTEIDSASSPSDYAGKVGSVTILAGKTTASVAITTNSDTSAEGAERLSVLITDAGSVAIHRGTATISIVDDEG